MKLPFRGKIQALKNLLLRNLGARILTLLLAIILWLHVVTGRSYEAVYQIPLRIENVPESMVIANPLPQEIAVKFFGQGRQLLRVSRSKTELVLKTTSEKAAMKRYPLSSLNVKVPIGLNVKPREIVEPKAVNVELNRLIAKEVEVISPVKLQLANGYVQVGPVRITPEKVRISGPQKFIQPVSSIALNSLSFSRVRRSITKSVAIVPPEGVNVACSPSVVELFIDIQALGERWIKDIPVKLDFPPQGVKARIEPSTIDLKVQGGVKLLASLTPEDISVYIDYRRVRGIADAEVPAIISPRIVGVELIEARPERFTVVIE